MSCVEDRWVGACGLSEELIQMGSDETLAAWPTPIMINSWVQRASNQITRIRFCSSLVGESEFVRRKLAKCIPGHFLLGLTFPG